MWSLSLELVCFSVSHDLPSHVGMGSVLLHLGGFVTLFPELLSHLHIVALWTLTWQPLCPLHSLTYLLTKQNFSVTAQLNHIINSVKIEK